MASLLSSVRAGLRTGLPAECRSFVTAATQPATWTHKSLRTGVIARKKGMTAMWDEWGVRIPVTVLQLEQCQVVQVLNEETHGYTALQIGSTDRTPKNVTVPMLGHFAKAGVEPKRKLVEFEVTPDAVLPVGTELVASHFVPGQFVDCSAPTMGKGFQGAMKRHGFGGQPASHGTSLTHRSLGSTGQRKDPGKVFKGKKMAGRMGGEQATVQSLKVMKIDNELNLIYVKGAVPGVDDQFVKVRDAIKKRGDKIAPADVLPLPFPTIQPEAVKAMPRELVAKTGGSDPYVMKE
ncbi:mitochondrial 50S ribosomal protein L3 [Linnemannia elongata]|uniref:Large ribosomal subunit protein uL3m n=1 Tax=Linnemannia elongata AG-77 TaxID=1314771 RepID=A0A197JNP2_9FUNG|nr:54S ribosomal protein L9, mitochondrial [Linnemannia elongata]OAQ26775.1 translation protein [Linnemannia elongata AG-77]KAF9309176.1 54S ribosomal protein L9, mitochondrial [Linnemannia elongata]KAG0064247.1 54S ribosomal protein L9, mitochondrial [Linnemannia elongata]KAG0072538.1 54S ribosomal protein L9, mitochondrial [Linnemannia elongata]